MEVDTGVLGLAGAIEIVVESRGVDVKPLEDFGGKLGNVCAIHTIPTNRPGIPFVSDNGVVLGGSSIDEGSAIAIDLAGNAYVTGDTIPTNFPTTPDSYQNTPRVTPGSDVSPNLAAFVTKIAPGPASTLATTTTTVTSSVNPSAFGQPVVLTALITVTGSGFGLPSGTVTFSVNGVPQAPVAVVPSATNFGQASARLTLPGLPLGANIITAS